MKNIKVPILMYHDIDVKDPKSVYSISISRFREHMNWLYEKGYGTIALNDLTLCARNNGKMPKKPLIITFDDGYAACYKLAYPILKEYGFTASFFITTNWIGKGGYMDWEHIKAMKKGGMEIGSHGHSHVPLSDLDRHIIKYELENSKLLIEEYLRDAVGFFSVPGGYFNDSIKQIAKEVGYKGVLTSQFGTNDKQTDLYELRRIGVRGYYTPQYLEKLMNDRINLNYRVDYFLRSVLKKSLGDRGYRWFLKHCFGSA